MCIAFIRPIDPKTGRDVGEIWAQQGLLQVGTNRLHITTYSFTVQVSLFSLLLSNLIHCTVTVARAGNQSSILFGVNRYPHSMKSSNKM